MITLFSIGEQQRGACMLRPFLWDKKDNNKPRNTKKIARSHRSEKDSLTLLVLRNCKAKSRLVFGESLKIKLSRISKYLDNPKFKWLIKQHETCSNVVWDRIASSPFKRLLAANYSKNGGSTLTSISWVSGKNCWDNKIAQSLSFSVWFSGVCLVLDGFNRNRQLLGSEIVIFRWSRFANIAWLLQNWWNFASTV